jgi:hypothetical protein
MPAQTRAPAIPAKLVPSGTGGDMTAQGTTRARDSSERS